MDSLADRWGVERDGRACVWLEIDRRKRILVVDDEKDHRAVIALNLASDGWTVEQASSGEEALACCHDSSFELLVLDHVMPGLSGIDVARAVRADGFNHPILIFSAYLSPDLELEASDLRAATLPKVKMPTLVNVVRHMRGVA